MSRIIHRTFSAATATVTKAEGEAAPKVVFVASDSTPDSFNDRVLVKGMDLARYQANPVLLWGHDHSIPAIGMAATYVEGDQLKMEPIFSTASQLAKDVGAAVAEGTIRACSVGLRVDPEGITENELGGFDFLASELVEISICNVPANPNALREKSVQDLIDSRAQKSAPAPELSPVGAVGAPNAAPTEPLKKEEPQMDPVELEKKMRAIATETVEKSLADRDSTDSTPVPAPVVVTATRAVRPLEALGADIQSRYAQKAFAQNVISEHERNQIVERAATLTAGSGLELNGRARTKQLIQAVGEKSFLVAAGAELWTDYETELAIGKWGGFTVSAVSSTGSPSDTSASTSDLVLKAFFGAAKCSVANALLANPNAGSTLAADLVAKLANFADTQIISGAADSTHQDGIKAQTASGNKVAKTVNATANGVLADLGKGLGAIQAVGIDTTDAIIVVSPTMFFTMAAARDSQGYAFPSMQGQDPRVLGRKVIAHSAVSTDAMILVPGYLAYGLPLAANVGTGLEGTDLSGGTQTVFGRIGYHGLMKHDHAAYFVTGVGAGDGWFTVA